MDFKLIVWTSLYFFSHRYLEPSILYWLFLFTFYHTICQVLGFGEYIEEVYAAYEQHKLETMVVILVASLVFFNGISRQLNRPRNFNLHLHCLKPIVYWSVFWDTVLILHKFSLTVGHLCFSAGLGQGWEMEQRSWNDWRRSIGCATEDVCWGTGKDE